MARKISLRDVESTLELKGKTARIRFIALKNDRVGFYAESYKTKQDVSIELTRKDILKIIIFLLKVGE